MVSRPRAWHVPAGRESMAFDDNRRQPAPRQERAARIETHANGANRTTNGWTDRRRTDGRCELCASKTSAANRRRKRGPRSAGHHCVVGGQSVAHSRRENLESGIDQRSGLAVHSLYTVTAIAPPDSLLRDIDALVFDLQDIGVRTWTYVGSMIYAMRAAARRQLPIVVLIARIRSPAITSTGRCSTPASRTPMSITRGDPQSRTHYTPSRYATE